MSGHRTGPHPWNDGFAWIDHDGPFTTITDAQAKQFDEDGFFVVEDAFDAATLAALDEAIAPGEARVREFLDARSPDGRFSVAGVDTQTVAPHLVVRSPVLRAFCAHPVLAGLCRDLVGPDVRLYWEQAVYKQPHSTEPVLWHQDNGYTFVEPQAYLTCWIAITDATPDNGCVVVMPGVHRDGTLRTSKHADRVRVLGRPRAGGRGAGARRAASSCSRRSRRTTPRATPPTTCARPTSSSTRPTARSRTVRAADGSRGPAEPQDDERRQYFVVRDGERVRA